MSATAQGITVSQRLSLARLLCRALGHRMGLVSVSDVIVSGRSKDILYRFIRAAGISACLISTEAQEFGMISNLVSERRGLSLAPRPESWSNVAGCQRCFEVNWLC